MIPKPQIGALVFFVSDIPRSHAFYRDVIGLDLQLMDDDGQGRLWMTATLAGGVELVFFVGEVRAGTSPIVVFSLADGGIDGVVAGLAEAGATIVTPVSHSPGGWSADFADPDGYVLSVYQGEEQPR